MQKSRNEGGGEPRRTVHERVIAAHAKHRSLTRPTLFFSLSFAHSLIRRARDDRASLQFRALSANTGHPDTCCRSIRSMIPYAKLDARDARKKSASRLVVNPPAIGSGTGRAKGGHTQQTGRSCPSSASSSLPPLSRPCSLPSHSLVGNLHYSTRSQEHRRE